MGGVTANCRSSEIHLLTADITCRAVPVIISISIFLFTPPLKVEYVRLAESIDHVFRRVRVVERRDVPRLHSCWKNPLVRTDQSGAFAGRAGVHAPSFDQEEREVLQRTERPSREGVGISTQFLGLDGFDER